GEEILFNKLTDINPTTCLTYNVKDADRGGISFYYIGMIDNRFISQNITLDVPWSNKYLDIKYESVRNLLLPGEKEQHKIVVKHQDKSVDAELLAVLYDASLDLLYPNNWNTNLYYNRYNSINSNFYGYGIQNIFLSPYNNFQIKATSIGDNIPNIFYVSREAYYSSREYYRVPMQAMEMQEAAVMEDASVSEVLKGKTAGVKVNLIEEKPQVRENLKETVFFFPSISIKQDGKVSYEFTMNEALTRWRLITMAHTKDMKLGYKEMFITTQKDLMIKANKPRILRYNDKVHLTANLSNLTDKKMDATVSIDLLNHLTDQSLDWAKKQTQTITLESKSTKAVSCLIQVPNEISVELLSYTVSAATNT
ncbi:MAG TPA: alpha-2-macroglobulin family protein, partial [Saprospiraceae bacterium]|nr:alpha-2-macroglobulin family protein [Saprospiraceae bacterium]